MDYAPIPGTAVIGLGHKARQGKDSVANFLIDKLGSKALRLGFADALYAVARVEHGMTTKDPKLLQYLGTEVFRQKDPEVWIRTLYHTALDRKPAVLIIPDVRFPNEAAFVKGLGGILVKVARVNEDGTPFRDPNRPENHPSESSLDGFQGWDFQFSTNSGNMGYLKFAAGVLLEGLAV